jgi:hypothetical protein
LSVLEHGTLVEQQHRDRHAARIGSRVQRSEAAGVPCLHARTMCQQHFGDLGPAGERGGGQRCFGVWSSGIDGDAIRKHPLDRRDITFTGGGVKTTGKSVIHHAEH